jgi:hypothetical protein
MSSAKLPKSSNESTHAGKDVSSRLTHGKCALVSKPIRFRGILLNMNGHFTGTLKRGTYELVASSVVDERLTLGWGRSLSLLICFVVCSD